MTGKRRTIITLVACLVVAAVAAVYFQPWQAVTSQQTSKRKNPANTTTADPVPVLAVVAKSMDVPVYLGGVGTGKALNTVTVTPQVDGKIIKISFTEGQDVDKGYVLAQIDPVTYQAAYDQTVAKKAQDQAMLTNARLDLDRYTRLVATNAITKQQLDTQKALVDQLVAQVQLDQAAIDNAKAILSYTDIISPLAGRTGIRMVDEGNIVRASTSTGIVILTQLRPISILFNLPQQELPNLTKGLAEGPLPIDALGADGKTTIDKGKVTVIDNQVDQTTGTVKLKAEFPNANLQIWPGQFVNVRVLIDTLHGVVVVPTAAIQRGPNGTFVYVVKDDNTVTVRRVTITQQDDVQAVVGSGVQAGEKVVTTGFARLTDGAAVTVSAPSDTPATDGPNPRPPRPPRPKGDGANSKSKGSSGASP
jgi:membrane fusion protein, multidrug efflux system